MNMFNMQVMNITARYAIIFISNLDIKFGYHLMQFIEFNNLSKSSDFCL